MKNFRRLCFAVVLTVAFSIPALAGDMSGPSSAPAPGDVSGPVGAAILLALQVVL